MRMVQMIEDTAGNRWVLEFDVGSTAPVRRWVEPPLEKWDQSNCSIIDYHWGISQCSDNQLVSTWNDWRS